MTRSKDVWLVFDGTDIQKYLLRKGHKAVDFAETLNVSAPTLNRWSTGSAPPSGPSVLILAILLRGQSCVVLQDEAPAWWRREGQKKRGKKRGRVSASVGGKPAEGAEEERKEDLFQFLLDKGRVREVAVSPRGLRCAEVLVASLSESVGTWQKTVSTKGGHLLGAGWEGL